MKQILQGTTGKGKEVGDALTCPDADDAANSTSLCAACLDLMGHRVCALRKPVAFGVQPGRHTQEGRPPQAGTLCDSNSGRNDTF